MSRGSYSQRGCLFRWVSRVLIVCFLVWYVPPSIAHPAEEPRQSPPVQEVKAETPEVRVLSLKEMEGLIGAGPYRLKALCGSHPWWPTYRAGVTVGTGNVSTGGTDLAIPAGRGLGISFTRTYNAHDDTVGAFGIGWTHSFDVSIKESGAGQEEHKKKDGTRAFVLRNADGLYTPPAWSHDRYTSTYQTIDNGDGTFSSKPTEDTIVTREGMRYTFQQTGTLSGTPLRRLTGIKDRNDNQLTLSYGATVTYPNGDTDKLLSSVTDSVGRQITLTWTNFGTEPNPIWRVTAITDGTRTVTYQYNGDRNLWKVTQTVGGVNRVWTYTYTTYNGEAGLLASITDPVGNVTTYSYQMFSGLSCIWVYRVYEPSGFGTEYQPAVWYPDVHVHLVSLGIPNGPLGDAIFFGQTLAINGLWTHAMGTAPNRNWYWDSQMNLTRFDKVLVLNMTERYTRSTYMTYDSMGNLLTVRDPLNKTTTFTYYNDAKYYQRETVTDALGRVTRYDYGLNTAPAGQRGSLLWVRDARYSQTGRQISFQYNSYGQKTQMTDLNNVITNYTYGDSWGNLTQVVQNPGGLNRTTSMQYDALGRVTQSTDPRNQTTTISYNEANQPTSVSYPGETVSYGYNADGSVASVTDNHGTVSYTYQYGRATDMTDSVTGNVHYTYDLIGNRTSVQAPNGETTTYTWDYSDWYGEFPNLWLGLAKVTDPWGKEVTYAYYNIGLLQEVLGNRIYSGPNLVAYIKSSYAYDANDRLLSLQTRWYDSRTQPVTDLLVVQNDYTYDDVGNRLTRFITNPDASTRTEIYGYDELYRLTSVNYGDGETHSYTFDPMGNRLTKVVNGVTESYTYNNANMLLTRGGASYTNDNNGNTLTGGGRTNTWDAANRLTQCTFGGVTSSFTYGADGLRRRMVVGANTTHYILDGPSVIQEKLNGTANARYLWGSRGPESKRDNSGNYEWYLYDGLGSVIGTLDNNGNLISTRKYDVYGAVRGSSGPSGTRHKFVGQLGHASDGETGLIYMRARYMDPVTGRFESEDPAKRGDNWFIYAGNNPIRFSDASGTIPAEQIALSIAMAHLGLLLLSMAYPTPTSYDVPLNHAALGAVIFMDLTIIYACVSGMGVPLAGNVVAWALSVGVGYGATILANASAIEALGHFNTYAAVAAVSMVVYATVCEAWILFIEEI